MKTRPTVFKLICAAMLLTGSIRLFAQHDVTARVLAPTTEQHHGHGDSRAALFWLEPIPATAAQAIAWTLQPPYRLLQKNKMFSPHLLVIPVGAVVTFPNADPFFHNVFSLFDGKRFNLGLYEAGRSRDVHFDQKGISYIFCNIHPQMGAVVIALDTPLWATPQADGALRIANVPEGIYEAHLWLEGEDERTLAQWTHSLAVHGHETIDAGTLQATPRRDARHLDEFNRPYKSPPAAY